ncbi:MAG: hypothetical protein ABIL09_15640, partial [Gemmatimonadota bacterium]
MAQAYTHRTAQGVWLNDMRNRSLPRHQWPSVVLDDRAEADLIGSMALQARAGFDSLTVFGLLTASSWRTAVERTVTAERRRRVRRILQAAEAVGLRVYYGLGVYSWGFDRIIAEDPAVRGPNPHAMCATREESQRWMRRIVDYLLAEFGFHGFHLEASDQGRCTCAACARESNTAYYSRINRETAAYIRRQAPGQVQMVNMCGYLPWGESAPPSEWRHLYAMGEQLDFLVDAGHAGYFIDPAARRRFIAGLPCAFGTAAGVWVYPPQRWDRLRWFIPYTSRTGDHLASLYAEGGRAVEYYMGPSRNPGVEVNIAFGGRKLSDVGRDNAEILAEVLDELWGPTTAAAARELAFVFREGEEAFFASFDPLLPKWGKPRGEIHLTPLIGLHPGPASYLRDTMAPRGRARYG